MVSKALPHFPFGVPEFSYNMGHGRSSFDAIHGEAGPARFAEVDNEDGQSVFRQSGL
jgi:hypothetical protein